MTAPDEPRHRVQSDLARLAAHVLALRVALTAAQSEAERVAVEREIDARRAQIDRLVYDLYGLTDDEIALVEESTPSP